MTIPTVSAWMTAIITERISSSSHMSMSVLAISSVRSKKANRSAIDIETAIAGGRRVDAKLAKPVPVAWVYMTGYGMPDGKVHFRDDVYGLDEPRPEPKPEPAIAAKPAADPVVTSSIAPVRR